MDGLHRRSPTVCTLRTYARNHQRRADSLDRGVADQLQWAEPALPSELFNVARRHAALFKILLVVILGFVEGSRGDDLRHDGLAVPTGVLQFLLGSFGGGFLLGRVEKNGGAVLCSLSL